MKHNDTRRLVDYLRFQQYDKFVDEVVPESKKPDPSNKESLMIFQGMKDHFAVLAPNILEMQCRHQKADDWVIKIIKGMTLENCLDLALNDNLSRYSRYPLQESLKGIPGYKPTAGIFNQNKLSKRFYALMFSTIIFGLNQY